jgi:hypothetical protein
MRPRRFRIGGGVDDGRTHSAASARFAALSSAGLSWRDAAIFVAVDCRTLSAIFWFADEIVQWSASAMTRPGGAPAALEKEKA